MMMLPLAWRTITLAALLIAITAVPARSQPYPNARTGRSAGSRRGAAPEPAASRLRERIAATPIASPGTALEAAKPEAA
jgi:hypothetical protein